MLSQRCVEEYKVPAVKSPVVDLEFDAHKVLQATHACLNCKSGSELAVTNPVGDICKSIAFVTSGKSWGRLVFDIRYILCMFALHVNTTVSI